MLSSKMNTSRASTNALSKLLKKHSCIRSFKCTTNRYNSHVEKQKMSALTMKPSNSTNDYSVTNIVKASKGILHFSTMPELEPEPSESSSIPTTTTTTTTTKTIPFLLADIGEGIAEVELLQWFVKPGDTISQFDKCALVQSDKATVEITSRYDGVVASLNGCNVGDMIRVGEPILHMVVEGASEDGEGQSADVSVDNGSDSIVEDSASAVPGLTSFDEPGAPIRFFSPGKDSKVLTTPAVRKLGYEHGIDLTTVQGSGPKGRILKSDILQIIQRQQQTMNAPSAPLPPSSSPTNHKRLDIYDGFGEYDAARASSKDEVVPIRGYNRLMVSSMTSSLEIPHMCFSDEVNVTSLRQCRSDLQEIAQRLDIRLSFLPFMIKAASLAMKEYPILNSSIDIENMTLTYHENHNIGIAMDSDRGLIVPVIQKCQELNILQIAKELNRLQDLTEQGKLTEADLITPTFSLSNIGSIGGTYMSPVVLPPQVGIGAIGKIQRLPRFVTEGSMDVEEAYMMNISWGADHRVVDGATLARFSNEWKTFIEMPMKMMCFMN